MKILLADDHILFREGLRMVFEKTNTESLTIFEANDFGEALAIARREKDIDLALIDFFMPGMDGGAGINALRKLMTQGMVVVISASEDPRDISRSLDAGAYGYIAKSCGSQVLMDAIKRISAGGYPCVIPETLTPVSCYSHRVNDIFPGLTRRQIDVLTMLAKGRSNKEIARELNLAEITVKLHVTAILKTLNVENRTQAAIYAQKMGVN